MNNTNTQDTNISPELAAEIEAEILLEETEATALEKLTPAEEFDYQEFWKIRFKLNELGLDLEVDFAGTIEDLGEEAIKASNLQLVPSDMKAKRTASMDRMTWDQQLMVIDAAQIVARADQELVDRLMGMLKISW